MATARNAAYAEEKAEVEVLKGQVAKHDEISKKLRGVQARLQGDGRHASDSLAPIHSDTQEHQIISKNIERLIRHIDKMLESGQDRAQEEKVIRAGPKKVGLDEYLRCMGRIDQNLEKMTSSKMRVQQETIGDYTQLLSIGIDNIQSIFTNSLSESSQTLEPLHYLTKDLSFPTLTMDKISQLSSIQRALSTPTARELSYNQRENVATRLYADMRSPYLVGSLQSLSMASLTTSRRKNNEEPYRPGQSAIKEYTKAMGGLFGAEYQNVSQIFRRDDWSLVLDATCRKAFSDLAKTLRELNSQIKANISTDCFLGYEIIELVTTVSSRLSSETLELRLPFSDALKPIRETAKASLPELLEDQRRRINAFQTLPPDGSAIPFTKETMTRLQMMTAFPRCLSSILGSLGDGNWTSAGSIHSTNSSASLPSLKSLDVGADGNALLSHYILDTLDAHLTTLDAKSRMLHKSKAISGVLLYNTIALIDRMIRSSDVAALLSSNPNAQTKMDNWRKKAIATYMDSWKEPSSALLDVVYTNRPSGNRPASAASLPSADIIRNLSSKDKDAIKEKFRHFNSSFDDAVRRHKDMMPAMEREVRNGLGREINNMIDPLYTRFFDKYEALDRGRGKYVRYDKGSLSAVLAGLS